MPITDKQASDLADELCDLASMIEGLHVLHDEAKGGCRDSEYTKRASNAFVPILDAVIAKAWALHFAILRVIRKPDFGLTRSSCAIQLWG